MICIDLCKNIISDEERYTCIDCGKIQHYKLYYNNFDVWDGFDENKDNWEK